MSQTSIGFQVKALGHPEEGLRVTGLFALGLLSLETASGACREPMPAGDSCEVSGRLACPRNSSEVTAGPFSPAMKVGGQLS